MNFLQGALILAAGGLISRALGAVWRFVLPWIMGGGTQAQVGLGLFGMAYPIYTIMISLAVAGVPAAVAKLTAEQAAAGRLREARRSFGLTLGAVTLAGLVFSLLLWYVAPYYAAHLSGDPRASLSLRAIAPAVLVVSAMAVLRGYFQGLQQMLPYAASQVIEQLVRILTMFLLAWLLLPRGIEYAAAGASFGAVSGAVVALAYLAWRYRVEGAGAFAQALEPARQLAGAYEAAATSAASLRLLGRMVALTVPISLANMILPVMNLIDSTLVPFRLRAAGFDANSATASFGLLSGFAQPWLGGAAVFTTALAMSLVPAIAEGQAAGRQEVVAERAHSGLRLAALVGLPAATGLLILAQPLPELLYQAPQAGRPLAALAAGAFFLSLQQASSAVLQGLGRAVLPMYNLAAGGAVKLVATWFLTALPGVDVVGAAAGTSAGLLVATGLNLRAVQRETGVALPWGRVLGRPALATLAMAGAALLCFAGLRPAGLAAATGGAVLSGVLVYGGALLAAGALRDEELRQIPLVGPRLAEWQAGRQNIRLGGRS